MKHTRLILWGSMAPDGKAGQFGLINGYLDGKLLGHTIEVEVQDYYEAVYRFSRDGVRPVRPGTAEFESASRPFDCWVPEQPRPGQVFHVKVAGQNAMWLLFSNSTRLFCEQLRRRRRATVTREARTFRAKTFYVPSIA